MTVVEFLQDKYNATGFATVTDWMRDTHISLSLQSCTTVLLRGEQKGLVVMLTIAAALKCSTEELQWVAKELGDKSIWRLIAKAQINSEQQQLIDDYENLSPAQKAIISSMIKEMAK